MEGLLDIVMIETLVANQAVVIMEDLNYKLEVKLIMKTTAVPVNMSNMKFIFKLISVYVESLIDMSMLKLI